jgi:hypothetical protein
VSLLAIITTGDPHYWRQKKDLIGSAKSGARQVIGQTTSEMAK